MSSRRLSFVEFRKRRCLRSNPNALTESIDESNRTQNQSTDSNNPTKEISEQGVAGQEGAASLLAQMAQNGSNGNTVPNQDDPAALNTGNPPQYNTTESEEDELLGDYIEEVVTAAIGLNRAQDLEFLRAEAERSRVYLQEQVQNIVRQTLVALTPTATPQRYNPPPVNPPPVNTENHNLHQQYESTLHPPNANCLNLNGQTYTRG